jgi:hypothetical protein
MGWQNRLAHHDQLKGFDENLAATCRPAEAINPYTSRKLNRTEIRAIRARGY